MIAETIPQIKDLTTEQKLLLAAELWDEAANEQTIWETDPAFITSLEKQLEEYRRDPSAGLTWEQVKARVQRSAQ